MNLLLKNRFNQFPFSPSRSPVFYGWFIILWGTLGVIMSVPGQTVGVSTFTDHLIAALKISRNELSLAYLLGTLSSSLILTRAGEIYDKIGARWLGVIITIALGAVLILLSQIDHIAFGIGHFFQSGNSQFYISFVTIMIGFFLLRFCGQGVLTMLSRNMMMKWFEKKRGLANGISNVFVALGFAIAPLVFEYLIENNGWRSAWIMMACIAGFGFCIIVFIFFRDNPEDCGLLPDGEQPGKPGNSSFQSQTARKQYTLREAKKTFCFWVFIVGLSMQALFITGYTFNIVSIFAAANMDKTTALGIFVPTSVISVGLSLIGGWLSDHIKLKYLLSFFLVGQGLAMVSMCILGPGIPYLMLIVGNGIVGGLYSVLAAVVWPQFFGRQHLGAISGFAMSAMVLSSALGPLLFSLSYTRLGSYGWGAAICLVIVIINLVFSFKADNPQEKRREVINRS